MLALLAYITLATSTVKTELRTVTAYTLEAAQTDSTPCIGATGEDLCKALADGEMLCAANFVPFGTVLHVEGFGACRVADRMAKKNGQKVDILLSNRKDAIKWGVKKRIVIYEKTAL